MLPRLLCDHLCSLHPGEDKLTFSVVWTLTSDGRVLSEWFGRSIIRSCCKLSYEHAQDLLDDPDRERVPGELPEVFGKHTVAEIAQCLHVLHGMTESMRRRRFEGGALRLDQVKVVFSLGENFQPYGFSVYEHTESHRVIEELMLLANMAVAHRLYKAFPEEAFLRSHPPPDDAQLVEVEALCSAYGVPPGHQLGWHSAGLPERYGGHRRAVTSQTQRSHALALQADEDGRLLLCGASRGSLVVFPLCSQRASLHALHITHPALCRHCGASAAGSCPWLWTCRGIECLGVAVGGRPLQRQQVQGAHGAGAERRPVSARLCGAVWLARGQGHGRGGARACLRRTRAQCWHGQARLL
ncbi:hypothetical protein MRX96_002946 [Rhipicephalus microplus]